MTLKEQIRGLVKEDYSGEPHWAGFTRWWLAARGYDYRANPRQVKFVDGAHDGGIDAIALPLEDVAKDTIFVVQSKFYSKSPTAQDVARFVGAVRAIRGSRNEFMEWLSTCREQLQPLYDKVREARNRCRYVVVTPCRVDTKLQRRLKKDRVEVFDARSLGSLERTYRAGRTPRLSDLTLKCQIRPRMIAETGKVRVHLFTVRVGEFAQAYRKHRNLLFSGNIRYALRGQTPKRVREGIDETLTRWPEEFVFSHNGVTMVGRSLKQRKGSLTIGFPSIVNGAQTVSYLGQPRVSLKAANSSASVIVKLIEVKRDEKLEGVETSVAYRSNNQNKVDPSDLMVDLPALVSLQRYFLRNKLLLERKKGEEKPHYCEHKIPKERLAQILAAGESFKGAVSAKRKQELFATDAKRLFESYDADRVSRLDAVCWVRIHLCLLETLGGYTRKASRRRAQLAQFAAITVFGNLIRSLAIRKRLMRATHAWESEREHTSSFLRRSFKEILSRLLQYSARDKKNEPAFYKAQDSVKAATQFAARKVRSKVRTFYKEEFLH